ncbi:hypothetical protein PBRA_002151 [Plasmodiophora brassicae]|uniref:Uncharacterized protein n=1 Tax=Plasmodiophora brassicae TaxID=37360 RepID=A0A0G4J1U8_PLABS|nr:hypothetical protein PBRA_002151 [Plasmodiophora brassicae]
MWGRWDAEDDDDDGGDEPAVGGGGARLPTRTWHQCPWVDPDGRWRHPEGRGRKPDSGNAGTWRQLAQDLDPQPAGQRRPGHADVFAGIGCCDPITAFRGGIDDDISVGGRAHGIRPHAWLHRLPGVVPPTQPPYKWPATGNHATGQVCRRRRPVTSPVGSRQH